MPLYPFMFVLPNGKLFDAGPDTMTRTLDLATGQWTTVGTSTVDGQSAVMYRPGQDPQVRHLVRARVPGPPVTNRAEAIDFNVATPPWTEVAPMKYRRSYHTLTVLPDGKVLATGGQNGHRRRRRDDGRAAGRDLGSGHEHVDDGGLARAARACTTRRRVLLPDGRVLLAGGGAFGNAKNENSGELVLAAVPLQGPAPAGHRRAGPRPLRPVRSRSTRRTRRGSQKVSLVRMGSVTHNFDMDQRFMPLDVTAGSGDSVRSAGPANANVAPPGWYMVFLVDDQGVPSHRPDRPASTPAGDTQAPTAPASLTATAQTDGAKLDLDGLDRQRRRHRVPRVPLDDARLHADRRPTGSPASRPARRYTDRGVAAGTYHYRCARSTTPAT